MIAAARALYRKDLRLFVRDRTALFFAFLLPIVLATVMGIALGGPMGQGMGPAGGASHAFASMAVMMLMFNLVAAAGALQDERVEGTLDRLRLTPRGGAAVLVSKLAVTFTLALVQLAVLFLFGAVAFDVPVLANLGPLVAVSLAWTLAASALGLVFATACRTRKQLEGLSTIVILAMSAIGGAWFPREITPAWFQSAGLATPVAWAMDAYHGVLWYGDGVLSAGEGREGVLRHCAVLLGFAAALGAAAARLYRTRFLAR